MRIRFLCRFLPALVLAALPLTASAGVFIGVSVNVPPPPLPLYVQPPCPQPGYIWVPGYWAWGPFGYYWVPGTWVLPPQVGLLWTPGYWGWGGGVYLWHAGYWGPRVGFYGGIDYGFGYDGDGFVGGFWRGGIFFYNRAVMRVGAGFADDVYFRRPPPRPDFDRGRFRRVSFNGGRDGIFARPNRMELMAARERRFGLTAQQRQHDFMARRDRVLRADFNHGRPPIAATDRPNRFRGPGVFPARARFAGPHGPGQQRFNGPARRFAPQQRGAFTGRGPHRPAPPVWGGPRYRQQPQYRVAPRFQTRPAPQFQHRPAPPVWRGQQFRAAPQFRYRPAPRVLARPAPRFRGWVRIQPHLRPGGPPLWH